MGEALVFFPAILFLPKLFCKMFPFKFSETLKRPLIYPFRDVAGFYRVKSLSLCFPPLQTFPVQAGLRFISPPVGRGAGIPSDFWDGVLPTAAAAPSQQRDQAAVYLQQASPLLQLEVHSPVCLPADPHAGPAAHICHW